MGDDVDDQPGRSRLGRVSDEVGRFLRTEQIGGLILLGAAALAMIVANSPLAHGYEVLRDTTIAGLTVETWAEDGLLAVFFVVAGLELKRELVVGELRHPRQAMLPVVGAVGGMVVPALVCLAVSLGILLGLVVGKTIGVLGAALLAVKGGLARKPQDLHWRDLGAVAVLTGCGFTVSLLLAQLAFGTELQQDKAKGAVLIGSAAAALIAAPPASPGPCAHRLTYSHEWTPAVPREEGRSMSERRAVDEAVVMVDGPWAHRFVSANGSRFHVAEIGSGPLVLLLHGFPEFWWAWHHQLPLLADAGYRAVAVDLRGYGASDKPPRGYDGFTLAADVTGLIRALGERRATVVGAGAGGLIAWAAAAMHPRLIDRLVVLGAAHPLRLRSALITESEQRAAGRALLRFQLPRYEHVLTRHNAHLVGQFMSAWTGPAFRAAPEFEDYVSRCREAMCIPQAAFCAMEAYRWAFRSTLRLHGYRFIKAMRQPIVTPTLQLQGALDTITFPATAQGSGRYVLADYEWRLLDGVGHFPHVESPGLVSGEIIRWAKN